MDRTRYSTIAHRHHVFCSPLSEQTVDTLLARMLLKRGARVLDVGCGKAQMLIRMVRRHGAVGVGVEPNRAFLAEANFHSGMPPGSLVLHAATLQDLEFAPDSFDAVLCIGATHACGTYLGALRTLIPLVRVGGKLVIGEGYWKQVPSAPYLEVLGGSAEEFTSHEGNIRLGEAEGLALCFALTSSDAEWDAYEHLYAESIERFVAEHPEDPDRVAMLARSRNWRDAYMRWGRSTLGFGVYAFQKISPCGMAAGSSLV